MSINGHETVSMFMRYNITSGGGQDRRLGQDGSTSRSTADEETGGGGSGDGSSGVASRLIDS